MLIYKNNDILKSIMALLELLDAHRNCIIVMSWIQQGTIMQEIIQVYYTTGLLFAVL